MVVATPMENELPFKIQDFRMVYYGKQSSNLGCSSERLFEGSGWCFLCKDSDETAHHLFIDCPFTVATWREALHHFGSPLWWEADTFEATFFSVVQQQGFQGASCSSTHYFLGYLAC